MKPDLRHQIICDLIEQRRSLFFLVALTMLFSCCYDSLYLCCLFNKKVKQCVFGSTNASFIMQIMLHLITVFGQWKMDNVGWEFVLDPSNKGNALFVEDYTKYEYFLHMVCEDTRLVKWKRSSLLICCLNVYWSKCLATLL